VPAMCDGITQGEAGMELSLFSRDVIALSTAVALSHQTFDAAVFLGICDKIVPGLVIGALSFGHLPAVFIPSGPMTSGLANDAKSRIRQAHAEGKVGREALLEAEAKAYHGPGTCTFYGTANTNQMLMEIMGLHLPGASFVNPNTPLRDALTRAATERALAMTSLGNDYTPLGQMLDERAFVNGVVGLHATGGSTNHTLHLVAIGGRVGIVFKEAFLARGDLAGAMRGFVEQEQLLLEPALFLGALHQVTERKRCQPEIDLPKLVLPIIGSRAGTIGICAALKPWRRKQRDAACKT